MVNISDEEKERLIRDALEVDDARVVMAASMVEPIRCGGFFYDGGTGYVIHGGYPYPERALSAARHINVDRWPTEWCEAYVKTNEELGPEVMEPIPYWEHRRQIEKDNATTSV